MNVFRVWTLFSNFLCHNLTIIKQFSSTKCKSQHWSAFFFLQIKTLLYLLWIPNYRVYDSFLNGYTKWQKFQSYSTIKQSKKHLVKFSRNSTKPLHCQYVTNKIRRNIWLRITWTKCLNVLPLSLAVVIIWRIACHDFDNLAYFRVISVGAGSFWWVDIFIKN